MANYTMQELAAHLKLDPDTIIKAIKKGHLEGHKFGRVWRFSDEQVAAYKALRLVSFQKNKPKRERPAAENNELDKAGETIVEDFKNRVNDLFVMLNDKYSLKNIKRDRTQHLQDLFIEALTTKKIPVSFARGINIDSLEELNDSIAQAEAAFKLSKN
ncbi:helix-turn-helix domain-containing protein [Ferruginibacter paludis]|uniref:helix-turn-helix domain-containing protein n=1 Tax=Ferruginibacter paludis TaxID=1310417 RepID=UPI0025B5CE36|nr:helix-turn-helix domain-containing protein [Ferruginibacter paludis]MDN3657950.1 helix-turn-helix domain-containing protein [Ferruginibacter paludis]